MASRVSSQLQRLLAERKIMKATLSKGMIQKELQAAHNDLKDSKDSLGAGKFKWATIQAYYSMFHSARALLYSKGYREKSHFGLLVAIKELYGNELGMKLINNFEEGMELRQEADYGLKFSEDGATQTNAGAGEFLEKAKQLLRSHEND
jgi:uncharacterized protein (UPF0332 family)